MNEEKLAGLNIGTILMKEESKEVLLGKRKGSHGSGMLDLPRGKLRSFERIKDCSLRELFEETGLNERNIRIIDTKPYAVMEDFLSDIHFISIYLRAVYLNGTPEVKEPKECSELLWLPWESLSQNKSRLFSPLKNLVNHGYNPFE